MYKVIGGKCMYKNLGANYTHFATINRHREVTTLEFVVAIMVVAMAWYLCLVLFSLKFENNEQTVNRCWSDVSRCNRFIGIIVLEAE